MIRSTVYRRTILDHILHPSHHHGFRVEESGWKVLWGGNVTQWSTWPFPWSHQINKEQIFLIKSRTVMWPGGVGVRTIYSQLKAPGLQLLFSVCSLHVLTLHTKIFFHNPILLVRSMSNSKLSIGVNACMGYPRSENPLTGDLSNVWRMNVKMSKWMN